MGLGFHYYLLELTKGRRGRGGGEAKVLPRICIERKVSFISTCGEPGKEDRLRGERAAAPGSSGVRQVGCERGVRAWPPSLRQQGVPQATGSSGWLSGAARSAGRNWLLLYFPPFSFTVPRQAGCECGVRAMWGPGVPPSGSGASRRLRAPVAGWRSGAARSVRQKFITVIFPPGFLLEQWGESGSCKELKYLQGDQKTSARRASDKNPFQYALAVASKDTTEKKRREGLVHLEGSGSCFFISLLVSLVLDSFPAFHKAGILPWENKCSVPSAGTLLSSLCLIPK